MNVKTFDFNSKGYLVCGCVEKYNFTITRGIDEGKDGRCETIIAHCNTCGKCYVLSSTYSAQLSAGRSSPKDTSHKLPSPEETMLFVKDNVPGNVKKDEIIKCVHYFYQKRLGNFGHA
jgi:hypothetical protein